MPRVKEAFLTFWCHRNGGNVKILASEVRQSHQRKQLLVQLPLIPYTELFFLTHFAPDCPFFFSNCVTRDRLVVAIKQMLHAGIPAYANRNGILVRLVASFLLLCTTTGDVLLLKFCGVWETMWIFKVVRWTHNRCKKIKALVSNGIRASSFEIWTANLDQLLTVGTLTNSQSFIFGDSNWKFC